MHPSSEEVFALQPSCSPSEYLGWHCVSSGLPCCESSNPLNQKRDMTSFIRSNITALSLAVAMGGHRLSPKRCRSRQSLKALPRSRLQQARGPGISRPPMTRPAKSFPGKGNVSGLSGNATAAHFPGPAEPGKNAAVMVPAPGTTTGAFEGTATLTDEQAKALTAGQTYFNVHTAANPNGELRAQLEVAK